MANASHGMRRTNADKRRAVMTILEDKEWSLSSDNAIAKLCSVDNKWVGTLRASLSLDSPMIEPTERIVERNGTTYVMDIANFRKPSIQQIVR